MTEIKVGQKYKILDADAAGIDYIYANGDVFEVDFVDEEGFGWNNALWAIYQSDIDKGYVELITGNESNSRPSTDLEKFLVREIFFLLVENSVEFKDGDFGALMIDSFSDEMKAEVVVDYLNMIKEQQED